MSDTKYSGHTAGFEELTEEETDPFLDRIKHDATPTVIALRLPLVKLTILKMDPALGFQDARFRAAVVLLSAALFVDARVDRLVHFTGYPMMFVAGIAQRMRRVGLWVGEEVCASEYEPFAADGTQITDSDEIVWLHCDVALGLVDVDANEEAGEIHVRSDSASKKVVN